MALAEGRLNQLKEMARIIRGLSIDGVQKANSGHPGMPMGMADVATVLWMQHLKHNPQNPNWFNRDRFVLSAGHGSMLIYSLLHLTGYDLSLEELKNFRQWHSKTPGHPEYGDTAGVETTTGPLGQGLANAVGMAIAESHLAARFNKTEFNISSHFTYVVAGDGCLMEGISHEACSLAGHLKLSKLILLYDDNNISIDGPTSLSFSEDVLKRFDAYGWHTQKIDGHNFNEIDKALNNAKESDKPSIIACKTIIGFGSPNKSGTSAVHGSPLGEDEVLLTKEKLGLPKDQTFYIPDNVLNFSRTSIEKGKAIESQWQQEYKSYQSAYPEEARMLDDMISGKITANWQTDLSEFENEKSMATRSASGKILDTLVPKIPQLIGGSADLTPSNNTLAKSIHNFAADNYSGRYIRYGVREHAMAAIMNGIALHGGLIPYAGTFLVFSDYMRNSIRLAAMMKIQVIYVFTHDSIGLGEDGPTHQPIEHLASLRTIPNLTVIRPADANETRQAWKIALENQTGPTALILTRQKIPVLAGNLVSGIKVDKGAYILEDAENPQALLMASGSEVEIALGAKAILEKEGIAVRVVSMPSNELFDIQDQQYKDSVLAPDILHRLAIEAGTSQSWYKYIGHGQVIGIDRFGASAPYQEIYEHLGLTALNVAKVTKKLIKK